MPRQQAYECVSIFACVTTFLCRIRQTCAFSKSSQKDEIRVTKQPVALVPTSTPQNTHRALVTLQLPDSLQGKLHIVQNFLFQMT